jgi:hypothetical protein
VFHQDNARAQKSCASMAFIHNASFENFQQSSYSPDLTFSDYFLFPKLKECRRGTHFSDDEEVMTSVNERLAE